MTSFILHIVGFVLLQLILLAFKAQINDHLLLSVCGNWNMIRQHANCKIWRSRSIQSIKNILIVSLGLIVWPFVFIYKCIKHKWHNFIVNHTIRSVSCLPSNKTFCKRTYVFLHVKVYVMQSGLSCGLTIMHSASTTVIYTELVNVLNFLEGSHYFTLFFKLVE